MTESSNNLLVLSRLLYTSSRIYVWAFNKKGQLLNSNCPDQKTVLEIYTFNRYKHKLAEYISKGTVPCVLGSKIGLSWGLVAAKASSDDDKTPYAFLVGPVFFDNVSDTEIYNYLASDDFKQKDNTWHQKAYRTISSFPKINISTFNQEILKFHYLATGCYDEVHVTFRLARPEGDFLPASAYDSYYSLYANEQILLNMIRTGDTVYSSMSQEVLRQSLSFFLSNFTSLNRIRAAGICFMNLAARAAIEGGVSVAEAFAMMDKHLINFETAEDITEIVDISCRIFDKYLVKVNELKDNPNYSPLVQKTVEYIEQHLGQKILAADIADHLGYNEYYLTKRFKEETGTYINEYIKQLKIKRAKSILSTTEMKVQEISDMLGFSTCNYFCTCFRSISGMSPQEYRLQSQNTKQYI